MQLWLAKFSSTTNLRGQNLAGSIFSQGEFFIRIESDTIPLRAELSDQYLVVDTYYRQLHLP